jgi:hypothetical protein
MKQASAQAGLWPPTQWMAAASAGREYEQNNLGYLHILVFD